MGEGSCKLLVIPLLATFCLEANQYVIPFPAQILSVPLEEGWEYFFAIYPDLEFLNLHLNIVHGYYN